MNKESRRALQHVVPVGDRVACVAWMEADAEQTSENGLFPRTVAQFSSLFRSETRAININKACDWWRKRGTTTAALSSKSQLNEFGRLRRAGVKLSVRLVAEIGVDLTERSEHPVFNRAFCTASKTFVRMLTACRVQDFLERNNIVYRRLQGKKQVSEEKMEAIDRTAAAHLVHLENHPHPERILPLEGLMNLKSLSLVALESATELPSFHPLKKLERFELVMLANLAQLPSLSSQQSLKHFMLQNAEVRCNGFVGPCDLSSEICSDLGSCISSTSSSQQTTLLLKQLNSTVCTAPLAYVSNDSVASVAKEDMNACGGIMYRQCTRHVEHRGSSSSESASQSTSEDVSTMCYNDMMQVISCTYTPTNIAIRKMQIQRGLGQKCDPVEEKWLGCPST